MIEKRSENSKSEIRNPKQIQMTEIQMTETGNRADPFISVLGHSQFWIPSRREQGGSQPRKTRMARKGCPKQQVRRVRRRPHLQRSEVPWRMPSCDDPISSNGYSNDV